MYIILVYKPVKRWKLANELWWASCYWHKGFAWRSVAFHGVFFLFKKTIKFLTSTLTFYVSEKMERLTPHIPIMLSITSTLCKLYKIRERDDLVLNKNNNCSNLRRFTLPRLKNAITLYVIEPFNIFLLFLLRDKISGTTRLRNATLHVSINFRNIDLIQRISMILALSNIVSINSSDYLFM